MRDSDTINSNKHLKNELCHCNLENSPCYGIKNVSIIVNKKKLKTRKKRKVFKCTQQPTIVFGLSSFSTSKKQGLVARHSSLPEISKCTKQVQSHLRCGQAIRKQSKCPFQSQFIVNLVSEHRFDKCLEPFNFPTQSKWKVYRCQLSNPEETCCCSCNSDAMFEVMKSLYDCYKKKNCDHCDCILCGHLQREGRLESEARKSLAAVGLEAAKDRKEKIKRAEKALEGKTPAQKEAIMREMAKANQPFPDGKTPSEKALIKKIRDEFGIPPESGLVTPLTGKTPEQKEKILRGLAMAGIPLPEGATPSEKTLIDKVRGDLGLPIEPKSKAIRDKHDEAAKLGILQPLEGKTPAQKAKILQGLNDMGIPLPEGRTPSEKAFITQIKARPRAHSAILSPSQKMRKAKAEGLLTSLTGKTREQKEKLLRGLANAGIPLPEGNTPSEKKIIDKVRFDLGLPIEPTTKAIRDKHDKAAKFGILQPLEGKTPAEKENILQGLHDMGIPLPEGRTPSEKALIAQVKARPRAPSALVSPSEKMRKAKAAGSLTPLTGKTPEQKEKVLRGLAKAGMPLPEGTTPSEKKIINKVRADLGLPIEPKTKSIREKHEKAAKLGMLQPLEGKTPAEKEKILQGLHDMGVPLPEGRTPSEKALIAQVKAKPRAPSAKLSPSEKMRKAKAEGLLTPLKGKTPEQKEKVLKRLAKAGMPLPEPTTPSEKNLINKVRADLGLPVEPKTKSIRDKHDKAAKLGMLQPLEGKTPAEKEKLLQGLHDMGVPLPEGRTPSEKALIANVEAGLRGPPAKLSLSEKLRKAKAEGLLTSLKGKTPDQSEKILRGLAMAGIPLPEGTTPSEKKLINKVRADLGLPIEPTTKAIRDKHDKAYKLGKLEPLEGKTPAEKEQILQGLHDMDIPLPEGRTPSEKALIAKIMAGTRAPSAKLSPSETMRKAKAEGLLTPLKGKTPEQKEKVLRGLAKAGMPLPEGTTPSEKKLMNKVRADLGLPIEPKTKSIRDKHDKAANLGMLQPLEGKTSAQKEKILQGLHYMGVPLPEGRTPSEKALIAQVKARPRAPSAVVSPSEKMRKAKAEGLLTPLTGKTPEQKEKIFKGLAMAGIPLPEGTTPSEKKLIDKVRADLGLPIEPKTKSIRNKHDKAAKLGMLQPLEGKTPAEKENILQGLHDMGIPLPEGRTPSEKALIAQVKTRPRAPSALVSPSEKMRKAKAAGLLTPLTGKTPEQKEKIFKGLAMAGIPLPEGTTPSEKKIIDKVRAELGLPIEPKTKSIRDKHDKAAKLGKLEPLEGKTPAQKEQILQGLHDMDIPLPEGRTPSEKALIAKVRAEPRGISALVSPSEKMRKAKAEGLLTPLTGKTPEQKEKIFKGLAMAGIPLPEDTTPSEKKIVDKVRADLGLPIEPKTKSIRDKHNQAAKLGLLQPLEGKTPAQKEKILQGLHDMGVPLPEGRTPSEKALIAQIKARPRASSALVSPSEKMRKAKAAGLLTPLKGKTPEQKEKIFKGLAMAGIPLPEGTTPSEKKLINKVRADLGLPIEPKTKSIRYKHDKAANLGMLQPLEGKTPAQKEKILQGLHDMGIPLPEGRTPSEKALIGQVKAKPRAPSAKLSPSEKMRKAKEAGLLTPLKGKTPEQKEKIFKGLAMAGIPLPEGTTPSEKKLINKVRADLGLPIEPKTKSIREKHDKAAKLGMLQPLEGKTPAEKENILQGLHDMGIPLPEGRTPSEKALIAQVKARPRAPSALVSPSEKMRKAKAEGLLTPLTGKTPEQKEKIFKGLAMAGIPLPEGTTPSEKKKINKVRADLGLPIEPTSKSIRDKHDKAAKLGKLEPLEGKTPAEKENILQGLHDMGIPLPEGRTHSEKALIAQVKARSRSPSAKLSPSEKMRKAKAAGLLTPLTGKTPEQKEKIFKGLAMVGIPLPEGTTPSEKKIIDKVRADLGLPIEPKTKSIRDKHDKAAKLGMIQPLEGKSPAQKEKILRDLHSMGIPLPEGRTPSEKALIGKIKTGPRAPSAVMGPSEILRKAKAEGLLTPLKGKTPEQKEKIFKGLAMAGIPLPEGTTPSEKKLINKIRADLGLPIEPATKAIRDKHDKAAKLGILEPLEDKTPAEKENILQGLHDMGIPLPEGRTPSEKALIAQVKARPRAPSAKLSPSEKMRKAKAEGLLTLLKGKTPDESEKILRGIAMAGKPLPEGKTPSEKKLINKVRADLGLPIEPTTKSIRDKHDKAAKLGMLEPLEGKTPAQKEKILRGYASFMNEIGIPLPEGRTPSEKALIAKIKAEKRKTASITTDKIRKAKAAGIFTPLAGKSPEQKEKILKSLAQAGLPLPEAKTPSVKALINKVKNEFGIPDVTLSEKLRKTKAAGYLSPLESKEPPQKEKILRGRAAAGLALPVGKTPSEKALIQKIKDDTGYMSPTKSEKKRRAKAVGLLTPAEPVIPTKITSSEKLRKAKDAGLLTPLEGKKPAEKEKIVKGLTELGLPVPATTSSEKAVVREAKAAGLFTPISGKPPAEKERILRGLTEAGLPLPLGKTASEKDLIKKVRAEFGMSPEPTPSEKIGKIKTKAKKVGISPSKKVKEARAGEFVAKSAKSAKSAKTVTCERGCGCDKKKIKFKHSYVKIKVTSPDISAFCDCPDECIPGVKAGAFIDNEGIKVTVGRAVGVPLYSKECRNNIKHDEMVSNYNHSNTNTGNLGNYLNTFTSSIYKIIDSETSLSSNKVEYILNPSSSDTSCSTRPYSTKSEDIYLQSSTPPYEGQTSKSDNIVESSRCFQSSGDSYADPALKTKSTLSSLDSILVIKSELLSLNSSASPSMDTGSGISIADSSITSFTTHYSNYDFSDDLSNLSSLEGSIISDSDDIIDEPTLDWELKNNRKFGPLRLQNEFTVYRMSETKFDYGNKIISKRKTPKTNEPVLLINHLMTKFDLTKIVDKILARNKFSGASSIFIVVPTSDDNDTDDSLNSITSINAEDIIPVEPDMSLRKTSSAKRDVKVCGKGKKFYMQEILSFRDKETMFNNESVKVFRHSEKKKNKTCQITTPNERLQKVDKRDHVVGTDTTTDRPCCCLPRKSASTAIVQKHTCKDQYVANVISGQFTPLILKQGVKSGWFHIPSIVSRPKESLLSISKLQTSAMHCNVPNCPYHNPSSQSCQNLHNHKHPHTTSKPKKPYHYRPKMPPPIMKKSKEYSGPGRPNYYEPNIDKLACESCSHKDIIHGLECGCDDINKPKKLRHICPCEEHSNMSKEESGPKKGTRTRGIVTELKSSQISKAGEVVSHTGIKKTRFSNIAGEPKNDKITSTRSLAKPDAEAPSLIEKENTYRKSKSKKANKTTGTPKEEIHRQSKSKKSKKLTGTLQERTHRESEGEKYFKNTGTSMPPASKVGREYALPAEGMSRQAPVQKKGSILSQIITAIKGSFISKEVDCQCSEPILITIPQSTSVSKLQPVHQPTEIAPFSKPIIKQGHPLSSDSMKIPPDLGPMPKQGTPLSPEPMMIPPDLDSIPKQGSLSPEPMKIPQDLEPIPKQGPLLPPKPMESPLGRSKKKKSQIISAIKAKFISGEGQKSLKLISRSTSDSKLQPVQQPTEIPPVSQPIPKRGLPLPLEPSKISPNLEPIPKKRSSFPPGSIPPGPMGIPPGLQLIPTQGTLSPDQTGIPPGYQRMLQQGFPLSPEQTAIPPGYQPTPKRWLPLKPEQTGIPPGYQPMPQQGPPPSPEQTWFPPGYHPTPKQGFPLSPAQMGIQPGYQPTPTRWPALTPEQTGIPPGFQPIPKQGPSLPSEPMGIPPGFQPIPKQGPTLPPEPMGIPPGFQRIPEQAPIWMETSSSYQATAEQGPPLPPVPMGNQPFFQTRPKEGPAFSSEPMVISSGLPPRAKQGPPLPTKPMEIPPSSQPIPMEAPLPPQPKGIPPESQPTPNQGAPLPPELMGIQPGVPPMPLVGGCYPGPMGFSAKSDQSSCCCCPFPPDPMGIPNEGMGSSCGWIDTGEIMKLRSELTRTTSGFKFFQKTRSQIQKERGEVELDFEDAIRYYASLNPERFRELMEQEIQKKSEDKKGKKPKKKDKKKKAKKGKGKKGDTGDTDDTDKKPCDCPYGPIPPPISYDIPSTPTTDSSQEKAPEGFKFSVIGQGSNAPGIGKVFHYG